MTRVEGLVAFFGILRADSSGHHRKANIDNCAGKRHRNLFPLQRKRLLEPTPYPRAIRNVALAEDCRQCALFGNDLKAVDIADE